MWLGALAGQSQAQLDGFKSRALRVAAPEQRHLYVTEWRTLEMVERAGGSPILVVGEEELCMAGSIRPASSVTYAELATQLGGDGWETVVARIATQRPRSGRIPLSALEVVLALVQAQAGAATVPMVWLLSSGVQAAGSGAVRSRNLLLEPAHAGAWGLARSARAEAQLPLCHLDGSIDRAFELDLALTEPELLLRLDSHLVPRLQHSRLTDGLASRMSTSAGDHLITGGTSGLGLLTGRWLAQGGARCVSLASRSGVLSDTAAEWGVAWASSTAVMSEGVDVGDGLHVHQLLYALPTLTGVWHAAGVLADGILPNQSTLAIAHVYSPKAHAAWALHSTSVVAPLQACVLFSSVASLFGGGGQANYAAANACLDMLATCRRVHGKAATSVQWGPWAEVGMTTRGAARKRIVAMAAMGFGSIIPFQGLAALDTAVRQHKLAVIGVVPVVWSRLLRNDVATPAFLSPFAHTRTTCTITATTPGAACVISLEAVAEMARRTAGGLLDVDAPLMEAGIDSLGAVELRNQLQSALGGGRMVSSTLIFDHPTVRQVVFHLRGQGSIAANMRVGGTSSMLGSARGGPKVVFAGLGMTLPMGTSSMTVLRKMCHCSCDLLRVIPLSRWGAENLSQDLQSSSREVVSRMRYGSFLHEAELFEHDFFRVSAAEALAMDPQQRQLLERGYMALHAAGMAKATLLGSGVAVNVGQWASEFGSVLLHTLSGDSVYTSTGSSCSVTCGRVSFVLGLHGPCASYDTACSASLVSNHGSVRALQRLECDAALSAGVNMILDPAAMRGNAVAGFTSVLGRSHTFDVRADGYARGEAIDAVACELSDAVAAVEMAGSAVRQDGRSASLTAPNGKAQQGVLMGSLADAQLMAQQVTGLEAHGTGTALGDPIETSAVAMVFLAQCSTNALAIGSLKANAGHTEPGAGLAGVLKQLVQLREGDMPPNAQLRVLNPHVRGGMCGHSACLLPMQVGGMSQREQGEVGGVSSFGYSGTIAHAVLHLTGEVGLCSPCAAPLFLPYRRHAFPWREASGFAMRTSIHPSVASPSASIHHTVIKDSITADTPLMQAGVTSISAVRLSSRLSSLTSVTLSPVLVFEQPTPRAIALHLSHAAVPPQFSQAEVFISIIEELLVQNQSSVPTDRTVPKSHFHPAIGVPADEQLPCSSLQHQLLLHQQLQPESTAYNEPVTIRLESCLTEPMARAALQALVRRHAVLRTFYALDTRAAAFYQVVLPTDGFTVPLTCCSTLTTWSEEIERELYTAFDLSITPPMRAILLQAEPSLLVVNVHHVAADMEAIAIMRSELTVHCGALAQRQATPPLVPLGLEYADYAVWEHARRHDEAALSWWTSQLQDAPELISLPLDRPRPNVQATAGSHVDVRLDCDLMVRVLSLCVSTGTTLNSALLSVWVALLALLSGQQDVVLGVPHSMRCGSPLYCLTVPRVLPSATRLCMHVQALWRASAHSGHVHQHAAAAPHTS